MATQRTASTHTNRDTLVGVFHSHAEAQQAIRELKSAGFSDSEIGVVAPDREGTHGEHVETEGEGNKSGTGAAVGATTRIGSPYPPWCPSVLGQRTFVVHALLCILTSPGRWLWA